MPDKLTFSNEVKCTVLEVKHIEGLGTTIDVILVNGVLREKDQIVVCGENGPIVTTIRSLHTPHPMKELRIKGSYQDYKELKAAQGIRIIAQGVEQAIVGSDLYVVGPEDNLERIKASVTQGKESFTRIDRSVEGVCVHASTLGSLEALLEILKGPTVNVPVRDVSIGPVHKKDVVKASAVLGKKEFAAILAFDVKVTAEAYEHADETGVKIFEDNIIYHLPDQFKVYMKGIKEEEKEKVADEVVFPCVLKIKCILREKDPIVVGVDVIEGVAKVGTPICIPSQDFINIGRIASIEINHNPVNEATKGNEVGIKITSTNFVDQQSKFGRHAKIGDELVSHITRESIDVLKAHYKTEISSAEWRLVQKLMKIFKIRSNLLSV